MMAIAAKVIPQVSFFSKEQKNNFASLKFPDICGKNILQVAGGSATGSLSLPLFIGFEDNGASDDEFFARMYQDYLDDDDSEKHETISLEELAEELGIELA